LPIDNVHLRRDVISHQVWDESFRVRTSTRNKRQSAARIPAGQTLNLADAEIAVAVVNDQIGVRTFVRRGQAGRICLSNHHG
jgi:hypothetical protein